MGNAGMLNSTSQASGTTDATNQGQAGDSAAESPLFSGSNDGQSDIESRAPAVVQAGRDRLGRFTIGNPLGHRFEPDNDHNVTHGRYRKTSRRELDQAIAEKRAAILDDMGGAENLSEIHRSVVDRLVRCEVFLAGMEDHLLKTGGPLSTKGHAKAAINVYQQLLDRHLRLSQALGLERRQRPVGEDFHALLAASERQRQEERQRQDRGGR